MGVVEFNRTGQLTVKTAEGRPVSNPLLITIRHSADLLLKLASEFGCTPAARARIHMAPEANLEPRGKFDGLIGRPTWGLTAEELRTNTRNPG
jgi:phage terminase small subunit